MENDKKIRKRIFMKALSTVKAVNEVDSVLDEIGINLDFDNTEKPVGRAMGNLLTTPKEVACDALGLTLKTEKGYCTGAYKGQLLPIEVLLISTLAEKMCCTFMPESVGITGYSVAGSRLQNIQPSLNEWMTGAIQHIATFT